MSATILGVDPGGTTGIAILTWHQTLEGGRYTVQLGELKGSATEYVLRALMRSEFDRPDAVAVESFVIGRKSGRAGAAGEYTRGLIRSIVANRPIALPFVQHSAVRHKAWSTDTRIESIGQLPAGLPHGRDALRVALFAAVHDYGLPDPLAVS